MLFERPEIQQFISACEKIQALLAQGPPLKQDERDVIEFCLKDLLTKLKSSQAA